MKLEWIDANIILDSYRKSTENYLAKKEESWKSWLNKIESGEMKRSNARLGD